MIIACIFLERLGDYPRSFWCCPTLAIFTQRNMILAESAYLQIPLSRTFLWYFQWCFWVVCLFPVSFVNERRRQWHAAQCSRESMNVVFSMRVAQQRHSVVLPAPRHSYGQRMASEHDLQLLVFQLFLLCIVHVVYIHGLNRLCIALLPCITELRQQVFLFVSFFVCLFVFGLHLLRSMNLYLQIMIFLLYNFWDYFQHNVCFMKQKMNENLLNSIAFFCRSFLLTSVS